MEKLTAPTSMAYFLLKHMCNNVISFNVPPDDDVTRNISCF